MEAERPPVPVPGCGRPPPRAAGRDPAASPMSVPAPPQGPAVGGGFAGLEFALPQEPEPRAADLGVPGTWAGAGGAAGPPTPSAHIPVPAQRDPPGKSRLDEVMAAAALTSLSTSTLLLGAPAAACSPEPGLEPWKEALVRPLGSCGSSGDWGWDLASDRSSPSIPSPPLPSEAAHFLFGEPAPKKRKSSVRVLFQCLWKRCGKVLSTASGMQRHIRLVHLGRRQAEPEQSDGEEDFYYTELDVGMDVLADGLSGLSPASPAASVPPASPRLELPEPRTLSSLLHPLALPPVPVLSPAAPREGAEGDDAYQGCLAPTRPEPQPTAVRTCVPTPPSRLGASPRKPRGDAKKCRKVYGMDHRHLWCTACRWKKACQRFLD
ncbi:LOW QUALITY PROTEIN: SLC2A4 regulator [Panthera pardus]|uniref:LOW QUALITY PROTEIN: SLC2A4 regulator n=1 Tax=Panthera pardus TaxID=9691 RepID=A0A9W2UIH1_PANPR|nr:LOW QUALITY PROTEIN: SLC2A4 regulator [Panthera pardus]